jgi:YihY family inner membrane protein
MREVEERLGIFAASLAPSRSVLKERLRHALRYWMQTEVHVYGFSIAANVLLSFFPFLIVMLSLLREVFGLHGAADAISVVLSDYFPGKLGDFIGANLKVNVQGHHALQVVSILLLLFTANGVFEPLEVALNRAWGIPKNRSFVRNQLVSLGLIFACGTLALGSGILTGMNLRLLGDGAISKVLSMIFFKVAAVPMSILVLFLIYWLLPNAKISAKFVLAPAIFVGLALEALKYINLLTWPLWRRKLHAEYGPFYYSVTILLWSFLASMVILAGAEWAAQASASRASGRAAQEGRIATPEA